AAFSQACSSLDEDQKIRLEKNQGLQDLFEQLNSSNEKSKEESMFRRGVQRLQPTLEVLAGGVSLASPLASLDPIANNAFGIIQSVMTIAIGICGAEEQFQERIQAMLEGIPIIERFDDVWDSTRSPGSLIFQVLVSIYKDLLEFYFEAMEVLKTGSFFLGLQKSRFRQKLPAIVSSFTGNTEKLDKLINLESLALIQKIDNDQSSIKVRMLLDSGSQSKEVEYYNSLKQRADGACTWITSTIDFREWLKESGDAPSSASSKFCILFGDMGSGKSVTTGFVVDFLMSHPALSGSLKPFVCVYYCKNDNETNKARNIYRSILWQILTRMRQLKALFMAWYKEAQTKSSLVEPTLDDNALRDFLVSVLRRFSRRVYLVLDGVDECDYDNRDHILGFFEKFHQHGAPVNVFLSSRYDETIKERLPAGRRILRMKASLDQDHMIATFQVNSLLSRQPDEIKELVIEALAVKAEGSALWLRMVLEYLRRPHRSVAEMKRDLQRMPSPKSLAKLYYKLFETAACGNSEYAAKIECALETLAVAGRLLTLDELACAVTLRIEGKNITSHSDLEEYMVGPAGLLELISPFVSVVGSSGSAIVRIVHQSLKEIMVKYSPANWGSDDNVNSERQKERESRLHSSLLECCTRYLLLSDLQEKELFPEEKLEAMEEQANDPQSPISPASVQPKTRDFDPESAGFGKFFTYAACYWTEHIKACSQDALPDVRDISKISRDGSKTLRNWMETYKRPSLNSTPQRNLDVEDFDELVVASYFGSHAFLAKYLQNGIKDSYIREESPVKALKWAMQSGDLTAVEIMVQDESLGKKLRGGLLLCKIMGIWRTFSTPEKEAQEKWKKVFEILVRGCLKDSVSFYEWANTVLCSAARHGCLPVVKILFEKASEDSDLAKALMAETQEDSPYQSIGEAAFWGRADVVEYLLTQNHLDITPHLHHRTNSGKNVYHCAVNAVNPAILRILIEKFPSGVNEQTESEDTPLVTLIFGRPMYVVEGVRVLVEIGGADVNLSPGGEWFSPLRTAIRGKNFEVCRILVSNGAHVGEAINIDESSGRVSLKDDMEDPEFSAKILKEFASASGSEACKR
ncbi:hypothetical protein BCR34DRAFT_489051, partial [Clohesyomyces aquaticus]